MPNFHTRSATGRSGYPTREGFAGAGGGAAIVSPARREITGVYMTMGAYDMVVVIDAPNDEVFASSAFDRWAVNIRSATSRRLTKICTERYRPIG
jgi:hypothetical protein